MSKEVLVVKHVPNEGAGTIAAFLEKRAIPFRSVELYAGGPLPSRLDGLRAVCIMGGPMNVDEEEKHPFLRDEDAFIRKLLSSGVPVLGVCLGSQLIAKALGCRVYKASTPEVGWMPVRLREAARRDALFRHAPFPEFEVLQWHEDTFDLPAGAELLASSAQVPHQAYRYGNVYGLQFHVEVDDAILRDWFKGRPDLDDIVRRHDAYRPSLLSVAERMYADFFGAS